MPLVDVSPSLSLCLSLSPSLSLSVSVRLSSSLVLSESCLHVPVAGPAAPASGAVRALPAVAHTSSPFSEQVRGRVAAAPPPGPWGPACSVSGTLSPSDCQWGTEPRGDPGPSPGLRPPRRGMVSDEDAQHRPSPHGAPPGASRCSPGAGRHPLRGTPEGAGAGPVLRGPMGAAAVTSPRASCPWRAPRDWPPHPQQGRSAHAPRAGRAADVRWSQGRPRPPASRVPRLAVEPGRPSMASVLRLDRRPRAGSGERATSPPPPSPAGREGSGAGLSGTGVPCYPETTRGSGRWRAVEWEVREKAASRGVGPCPRGGGAPGR